MAEIAHTPRATYRLQFNKDFTFEHARAVVGYLARLGVSHVYASPYLKARAGSSHGYDIIDHNALNPEIGSTAEFEAFADALAAHGIGQILDFVPNHMGIGRDDNAWWLDVLEWGEDSPYAEYFDIDWQSIQVRLRNKVLVPSLGDHYGKVLEAGDLRIGFDIAAGTFSVWYHEHRFPVTPGEYERILRPVLGVWMRGGHQDGQIASELQDLMVGFRDLGDWHRDTRHRFLRREEAQELKDRLAALADREHDLARAVADTLDRINGSIARPETVMWLHELLEAQHYRLAYWRVAAEEINYRRFFQINELAGIRVELPAVFEATHRLVLDLIRRRRVHGLRIDHVDGLFDPKQYLERLQAAARAALDEAVPAPGDDSGATETAADDAGFYVVVEKILAAHEWLREDWPIAGTTGYEFLNRVHGLFIDPEGGAGLQRVYDRFVGDAETFEEIAYVGKRQVMDFELASELRVLASEYDRLSESSWFTRDYTLVGLRQALREVVACFPVYRTYVDAAGATAADRRDIDWAIAHARRRSLRADKSVFDFIHESLTTDLSSGPSPYNRREVRRLAMKFQQYTGPVAAKGVEDTAFYRYNRLISTNEVGGEPTRFGVTVAAFHKTTVESARRWPDAMLATATHDTKRGEDARVRIDVLSEIPAEWGRRVRRWATLNHRWKATVNDEPAPSVNDEYLFYQALVGAWPAEFHDADVLDPAAMEELCRRLSTYMTKAVREAKTHSSWINPSGEYEDALLGLVTRCLDVGRTNPFLADFRDFHRPLAVAGMVNGLAQAVVKLTAPGVPDVYQGCELWDFSLVDPDNRRPVDFDDRARRLAALESAFALEGERLAPTLLDRWPDGDVKLFVVWRLLNFRRRRPDLFAGGAYTPAETAGAEADRVCSYFRGQNGARFLVIVPRLVRKLVGDTGRRPVGVETWGDTAVRLPEAGLATGTAGGAAGEPWWSLFTGRSCPVTADGEGFGIRLADALAEFPVAVLTQAPPES